MSWGPFRNNGAQPAARVESPGAAGTTSTKKIGRAVSLGGAAGLTHGDRMSDNSRHPTDIVMDAKRRWRALYSDGSLGPALTLDQMLDLLPQLRDGERHLTSET
jgi:hypothetical protein